MVIRPRPFCIPLSVSYLTSYDMTRAALICTANSCTANSSSLLARIIRIIFMKSIHFYLIQCICVLYIRVLRGKTDGSYVYITVTFRY